MPRTALISLTLMLLAAMWAASIGQTPSIASPLAPAAAPAMANWRQLTWVVHAYANFGPNDERIVFQSNATGNWDIYAMNADGSQLVALTNHGAADITPGYSPDGSQIVFVSERDGNREVYLMNADGYDLRRLTTDPGHDLHPVWNADGTRLMFSSNRGKPNPDDYDIYTMKPDGSDLQQITRGPEVDTYASWSPDGSKIITRRVIDRSNNEVFIMNADGSDARNLTKDPLAYDGWPVWSPDGSMIAFASGHPGGNHFVFIMKPDGSDRRQVTAATEGMGNFCYNTQPCFSRDGKRLAYTMYRPGHRESAELCVIDVK